MLRVGLTGGIACGKSAAATIFRKLQVDVIDADELARELSEQGTETYQHIVQEFGRSYITNTGALDRRKLRLEIFNHPDQRACLEKILHPPIRQALLAQTQKLPEKHYCILSIPLLFEAKMDDLVDQIIVISCPQELQIQRLMARDNCDRKHALQIIQSQKMPAQSSAKADFVISNAGDAAVLESCVRAIDKKLRKLSAV